MIERESETGRGNLLGKGDLWRLARSVGRARRPRFETVAPTGAEELSNLDPSLREAAAVLDDPEVVRAAQVAVIDAHLARLNAQLSEFELNDK